MLQEASPKSQATELERLIRLFEALSQINQAIVKIGSRDALFGEVSRVLVSTGGFSMAWVGWLEPTTRAVLVAAHHGDSSGYLQGLRVFADDRPEGKGPTGVAMRKGRPYICNDFMNDPATLPWRAAAAKAGWGGSAAFPLRLAGEVKGALSVYANEAAFFGEREVSLLVETAADVSFALDTLEREAQRARTELALSESEARLRMAVEAANVGFWDWDLRTNQVVFSAEWKRQLGYRDDELSNDFSEWQNRVHPDDLPRVLTALRAYLDSASDRYEVHFRLRHKDGSYREVLARGAKTLDGAGQPIRMVGSHLDITEHSELQARFLQAQKMESVGRLAGGVAHDFNNLLSVILSYAQLVTQQLRPGDPLHEFVEQIGLAGERAADLTRRLLAFSRRQILNPRIVDLSGIVADMETMLKRLIGAQVELTTTLSKPGAARVYIDPGQFEQVIMNLVVNASDAMPKGGRVSIRLEEALPGGALPARCVVLTVSDTGTGISEAIQPHIFEPFFTTKEQGKGTGLGLSTVFGIVSQSGGTITLKSQEGQGTTFTITLPAAGPEAAALPGSEAEALEIHPKAAAPRGVETILLVDDEAQVRTVARLILERNGYRIVEAQSGGDALVLFEKEPAVALLLTDIVMPHMSGTELAARLLAVKPGLKVLYVSGNANDAAFAQQVAEGRVEFLQKPIHPLQLLQRVRRALDAPARPLGPLPLSESTPLPVLVPPPEHAAKVYESKLAATSRRPRVLVIDDEQVMQRLISRALRAYDVVALDDAEEALARISSGERFDVILCDLHMKKKMSGGAFHEALSRLRPAEAQRALFMTGGATTPEDELFLKAVAGRVLQKPIEVDHLRAAVRALLP